MHWIIRDLRTLGDELKQSSTWITLGLMAGFGVLIYVLLQFALRTDELLRFLHISGAACREMTNGAIIAMFFGMIFFTLFLVATFGSLQQFFRLRHRRGGHAEAALARRQAIIWGATSVSIAIAALSFFINYCR